MSIKLVPARPSDRLLNRRDSSQLLGSQRHMGHTGAHFLMLAVFIKQKLRKAIFPPFNHFGFGRGRLLPLSRARGVCLTSRPLKPIPDGTVVALLFISGL